MKKLLQKIARRFGSRKDSPTASAEEDTVGFSTFRQRNWEEDISLNHDSLKPFENAVSPAQLAPEAFEIWSRVTQDLLNGQSLAKFVARDVWPIPHARDREGYQVNFDPRYFLNGLADYLKIQQAVKKYDVEMNSYFDFGCASGRVLRQFCAHSEIENLWGCDINGRHVKWINDFLPAKLKIVHSNCLTHIPMASNSIDVISAFSVFSHIDTFESGWLSELHRVLKPNGMVFLTIHNDATWAYLQKANQKSEPDYLLERLCEVKPGFRELLSTDVPSGRTVFRYTDVGPYRALVFHSDAYLRKTWGRFFEVLEIEPEGHGVCQSIFVGRKKC